MRFLSSIEKLLIAIRDIFWGYPEYVFVNKNSHFYRFRRLYQSSRPLSYILTFIVLFFPFTVIASNNSANLLRVDSETFIEGVIVGVDDQGELLKLSRINPLINTNIQLEKDLIELIYEPLIRIEQDKEPKPVLADYGELDKGKLYRFRLNDDIYWSDGEKLTTTDVIATFELLKTLESDPSTSTIHSRASTKIDLIPIDELTFEFKLNSAIPTFFEAISFKILPAHLITDMNRFNIASSDPYLNRNPVGTGIYKLAEVKDNEISLDFNNKHLTNTPNIKNIKFKLFSDEKKAQEALIGGQVHAISSMDTDTIRDLQSFDNIEVYKSSTIYNQYWGLYFNLSENGPKSLQSIPLRSVIASGINRERILISLLNFGVEAKGPIPETSWAYSSVPTFRFNKEKAIQTLQDEGWTLKENESIREKDGEQLKYQLFLVNNPDRVKIAENIKQDLFDIGIEIEIIAKSKEQLVSENIVPRSFDLLLYGVQAFIDPDRYELFHSSQISHPGLNISSYASKETVLTVIEGEQKRIPKVDDALDDGRKFVDQSERKSEYQIFQTIVGREAPVVFLFHPQEAYAVNKRVKGIDLNGINSLEERFFSIYNWSLSTGSTFNRN